MVCPHFLHIPSFFTHFKKIPFRLIYSQFLTTTYIQLPPNYRTNITDPGSPRSWPQTLFPAFFLSMFSKMYNWTLNPNDQQAPLFLMLDLWLYISPAKKCNLNHAWSLNKIYFSLVEIHSPPNSLWINEGIALTLYKNRICLPRNYLAHACSSWTDFKSP